MMLWTPRARRALECRRLDAAFSGRGLTRACREGMDQQSDRLAVVLARDEHAGTVRQAARRKSGPPEVGESQACRAWHGDRHSKALCAGTGAPSAVSPPSPPFQPAPERGLALPGRAPGQQSLDADVLVDCFPVDAFAAADQPVVRPFGSGGVEEPREPRQGDRDRPAVAQVDAQGVGVDGNAHRVRQWVLGGQSTDPIPPGLRTCREAAYSRPTRARRQLHTIRTPGRRRDVARRASLTIRA